MNAHTPITDLEVGFDVPALPGMRDETDYFGSTLIAALRKAPTQTS